ncbi:DUF2786 domain-containing protein [Nocardia sp. NBC_00881]|uniref:DUF2786 domain-containing protein n=1 Tax=Nocardia sp. NBC_00881 TaxID=2975995 RepID=UPI00386D0632
MLARIGAVRKAEGTDNAHETDAFSSRAQRLATQHSIGLAVARPAAHGRAKPMPVIRQIPTGERGTRGMATYPPAVRRDRSRQRRTRRRRPQLDLGDRLRP